MNQDTRTKLESIGKDEKYKDFSAKLVPNCGIMLGIRIPELRKMAKELTEDSLDGEDIYFEEVMLRGFVIAGLKQPLEQKLETIKKFIPKINNWSVCDSFITSLKFQKKDSLKIKELILPYSKSEKEFECRFAAVMLWKFFINQESIDWTLQKLSEIHTEKYYSSMGVAWALAECFIKFPDQTASYLSTKFFDPLTIKRSIRKICDSYRIENSVKERLKKGVFE